jgi:hypothetical protein
MLKDEDWAVLVRHFRSDHTKEHGRASALYFGLLMIELVALIVIQATINS